MGSVDELFAVLKKYYAGLDLPEDKQKSDEDLRKIAHKGLENGVERLYIALEKKFGKPLS